MTMQQGALSTAVGDVKLVLDEVQAVRPYLHSQGPIDNFIHHNTFHDFEDQEFETTVEHVARVFHAQPYLKHTEYRDAWLSGRIETIDVTAELSARQLLDGSNLWQERVLLALLQVPQMAFLPQVLKWWLEDGPGFRELEVAAAPSSQLKRHTTREGIAVALRSLFAAVEARAAIVNPGDLDQPPATRPTEDKQLNDTIIRIVSAYLDRGTARWHMPERDRGLWYCANRLMGHARWLIPTSVDILKRSRNSSIDLRCSGLDACVWLLEGIETDRTKWRLLIREELLTLPGWAGTIVTLDERSELPDHGRAYPAVIDYLAIRLLLRRSELSSSVTSPWRKSASDESRRAAALQDLGNNCPDRSGLGFKLELYRVCQVLGLCAADIPAVNAVDWENMCSLVTRFPDIARRRILHSAYERAYHRRFLNVLHHNVKTVNLRQEHERPKIFQVMFCLDEREESLRRHVEEVLPDCETFGAAGFFGIDMLYQPHDAVAPEPFCPAPVKPKHVIKEKPGDRLPARKSILRFCQKSLKSVRKRLWGVPLLPSAALTDALHMFLNVHMPRSLIKATRHITASDHRGAEILLTQDAGVTRGDTPHFGFTIEEMSERIEGLLRTVGLTEEFAPLVFLIGHGSTTTNNHFQSAYDCGACGGRRGQYNGRVFAAMANMPEIRALLADRGIMVPEATVFVGGIHDTCSEEVIFFDSEPAKRAHARLFSTFSEGINEARRRNAHERYRRFGDTRQVSITEALAKVEARAHHAGEVRPEYGHGSNAASFVGRRSTTQGLFLDRRCFLTSYDASNDPNGKILKGLLAAIMPVCSGISLEYYFSRVDNQTFGCGTKLPHNLTSMVGIVDGPASDLRTGLPWQTVEIHEPMRLLTVIEAELGVVSSVLAELPHVLDSFDKGWGHLAVLSPLTGKLYGRRGGGFKEVSIDSHPCQVVSAKEYYSGRSDHLEPAMIKPQSTPGARNAS